MKKRTSAIIALIIVLAILILAYMPTLLTQINGSSDPYMIDVGEVQTALNVWGTIHATGYPLYDMVGSFGTAIFRTLGANPAAAPCLFSMAMGLIALSLFYALVLRLTARIEIAALTTLLLGLTQTVWAYNVVAKEYSMNTLFEIILLIIALWPPAITAQNVQRRVWLLALVGGLGVAHHRTVIFLAPGLIFAVLPGLRAEGRRAIVTIGVALIIGLLGFLPYIYLPSRAVAHGDFVYGDPTTVQGFLDQFLGREASHLSHLPVNGQAWLDDFVDTFRILINELTPIPFLLCVIGAIFALVRSRRREVWIVLLCAPVYLLFLFTFHQVVMPQAVAMPVIIFLMLLIAFGLENFTNGIATHKNLTRLVFAAILILAPLMIYLHHDFIYNLTHDDTGLQMIALAKQVPRDGSVFMLSWGPRFHAVAFSKYVTKENGDLPIVTHTADFASIAAQGHNIYTSKDTFYDFPLSWWESQIGRAYPAAPADGLVALRTTPLPADGTPIAEVAHGVAIQKYQVSCSSTAFQLEIDWKAESAPDADLSVFVHLLSGDNPVPVAQDDRDKPVYGLYPTTHWTPGELVIDHYALPRLPNATQITFGMYNQDSAGKFVNYGTQTIPTRCDG